MKAQRLARWGRWLLPFLAPGLLLALCAAVFSAWLSPQNVAAWLMLSSFCS